MFTFTFSALRYHAKCPERPGQGGVYYQYPAHSAVMSRLCILTWTKVKRRGEDWSLATRSSYAVAENRAVANAYRTTYLFTVSYQSTIAVNINQNASMAQMPLAITH